MSDQGSTESDDMTVEDQNHRNSETDDTHNVLGSFLAAKEETLEDLVGGLMFLTMEDVRNSSLSTNVVSISKGNNPYAAGSGRETRVAVLGQSTSTTRTQSSAGNDGDTELDIEEEILHDPVQTRPADGDAILRNRPVSLTKFDNFIESAQDSSSDVEDDALKDEEDDWMPTAGYMASFAAADNNPPVCGGGEDPSQLTTPANQPTQPSSKEQPHRPDAAMAVPSARETVAPSPKSPDCDCDDHSEDYHTEREEGPAWMLNPGEAEEEISSPQVTHTVSTMEYAMTVAPGPLGEVGQVTGGDEAPQPAEECNDEVLPFELDSEFDYDNVIYTPKFTQAEMTYLKSFLPSTS